MRLTFSETYMPEYLPYGDSGDLASHGAKIVVYQQIRRILTECQPLWAPVDLLLLGLNPNRGKKNTSWCAIWEREVTLVLRGGDNKQESYSVIQSHFIPVSESYILCEANVHFDAFHMSSSARKVSLSNDRCFPCWHSCCIHPF